MASVLRWRVCRPPLATRPHGRDELGRVESPLASYRPVARYIPWDAALWLTPSDNKIQLASPDTALLACDATGAVSPRPQARTCLVRGALPHASPHASRSWHRHARSDSVPAFPSPRPGRACVEGPAGVARRSCWSSSILSSRSGRTAWKRVRCRASATSNAWRSWPPR